MYKKPITEFIISSLANYPYIFSFFICIFLNSFFYCSIDYTPLTTISLIVKLLIISIIIIGFSKYKSNEVSLAFFLLFVIVGTCSVFYVSHLYHISICKEIWLFIGFFLLMLMFYFCSDRSKYKIQTTSLLIIGISFSLCFCYILNTSIFKRQNDAWFFSNENGQIVNKGGHIAYIQYIQNNHSLPNGDVSKIWQFAHPPLYHIISAVCLELNEYVFSLSGIPALENLQILTLFFIMCTFISSYKIFRYFELTGIPLYCSLTITCFFPTFIFLTGTINNDVLSIAFIVGTMLSALNWKKNPNTRNILKIALCLGLGMMTKVSSGTIIPALFVLFVSTFLKNTNKKELLKQFIIFLIVSIPLGTWFNIKNYVKYNIPFNFVHDASIAPRSEFQYVGDKTFFDRITDFSFWQFDSVFVQCKNLGFTRNDYNPVIVLLKSALFSEFINNNSLKDYPIINKVPIIFFIIFVFITIISLLSIFYGLSLKNYFFIDELLFMFVFFVTLIIAALIHSYNGPYIAYMNFRFITPTVIIGQVFSGLFYQNSQFLRTKHRYIISSFLTLSFAICSTIIFINLMISLYTI